MTDNLPPHIYGIWIKGTGWLRLPDPKQKDIMRAYSTLLIDEAKYYAKKFNGEPRPFDPQLEVGEKIILEHEMKMDSKRKVGKWL